MPPKESTPEPSIPDLLTDLFYPSESDEPVDYVAYTVAFEPPLTVSQVKNLLLITPEIYVREIPEDGFWKPVVTDRAWYDEDEKKRTTRFIELQKTVQALLSDRQVFLVDETEVGLYLLGRKGDGCWAGLKTLVVDT